MTVLRDERLPFSGMTNLSGSIDRLRSMESLTLSQLTAIHRSCAPAISSAEMGFLVRIIVQKQSKR